MSEWDDVIASIYDLNREIMREQRAWVEHVHASLPAGQALAVLMGRPMPERRPAPVATRDREVKQ